MSNFAARKRQRQKNMINRELIRKICKYINLLSGTYLLDSLDKEEIYSKVIRRIGEE